MKPYKRLVFWLPTKACVEEAAVEAFVVGLQALAATRNDVMIGKANVSSFMFIRVVKEEVSENMWRWLCVFEKQS